MTPDDDRLPGLAEQLAELDGHPVAEHPDVLESVHKVLVAELESLAGGPRPTLRT